MGLEKGISKAFLLGWASSQIARDPAFAYVVHDQAMEMEQVYFTVRAEPFVERRYKLTIEGGRPIVEQVEGSA